MELSTTVELSCTGPHAQLTDVKGPSGSGTDEEKLPSPPTETDFFLNPAIYNASAEILHVPRNDVDGVSALFTAAKEGHEEAVAALLRSSRTNVNVLNRKGVSPLSVAAQRGNPLIVEMLIKSGAEVNMEGHNGATALIQASHFGYVDIVRVLLRANADVDKHNFKGTTAIMRAAQEGKTDVVRVLAEAGACINRRNNEQMNALMLASQRGHAPIVRYLLQRKAEVDSTTSQGSTALMLACKRKHIKVVEALLVAGADMHLRDCRNRTARETAEKREFTSIVKLLNNQSQLSLMRSAARKHRALYLPRAYKIAWGHGVNRKTSLQSSLSYPFPGQLTDSSMERSPAIQILRQTFRLPWYIFDRIVSFIPLPHLWQSTLKRLRMQRHANSDDTFRSSLEIANEILNDALQTPPPPGPPLYLVAVAKSWDLQSRLVDDMGMPPPLLKLLIDWSDTQSQCSRLNNSDVTFLPPAAEKILKLAEELMRWHDAIEYGVPYNFNTITMLEPVYPFNEYNDSASMEMQHGGADGSSDGEMDV